MPASRHAAALIGCIATMFPQEGLRADIRGASIPRVSVPTSMGPTGHRTPDFYQPYRPVTPASRVIYPWKKTITCTIFWIGEQPTARNPTPNCKSSWDTQWAVNFGGYDNPDPDARIADHVRGEFRPKGFIPRLNPFYVALPYNDVINHSAHKPEAPRVIPWFSRMNPQPGKTVLKGRWIHIHRNGRNCFAQWEDCGPWTTDDWEYVFGNKPPKNVQNGGAGIDISPAVRDYLGIQSGQKVHWRFVEASQVPYGPWKKYGQDQPTAETAHDLAERQRRLEHLRKLRDENFRRKPLDAMR
ncbi:MAG: hypothetical protein ACO3JG_08540 [Luteolibacter sp.]